MTITVTTLTVNLGLLSSEGIKTIPLARIRAVRFIIMRNFFRLLILSRTKKENTLRIEAQTPELFKRATIKSEPSRLIIKPDKNIPVVKT